MHDTNLSNIDLNLLHTLDVLLAEESVTRAAQRLGRSQPAVSHALAKLRELFDDPLLVQHGRGMRRTPKADALAGPLERALRQMESVLALEQVFDPQETRRVFGLGCSDALGVLLGDVLQWFGEEAPQAHMDVSWPQRGELERSLELGRYDVALAPVPLRSTTALRQLSIGPVSWRTLMRPRHPLDDGAPPSLRAWTSHAHVVVRSGSRSPSAVEVALERKGTSRRVGLTVPGFLLGPRAVVHSNLLFTAPHIVARDAEQTFGLVAVDPPLEIPGVHVAVMWHERWDADPGHTWFREGLARVVRARWSCSLDRL